MVQVIYVDIQVPAYLGDIPGSVLQHPNKPSHNLFADGGSCLQFIKNATSVGHNRAKRNKMRYAYK